MNPSTPPGQVVWACTKGKILSNNQRPSVSVSPTNSTTSMMVCFTASATLPPGGGCSIPSTSENRIHPTRSSNMADEMMTVPTSVRRRFRSIRIFAITGSAEIARAVPTNSAKMSGFAPCCAPRYSGKIVAARNPEAKGNATPKILTSSALLPCRKRLRRSISRPAVSKKKTTPSVVTVSSTIGIGPVVGNSAS
jgi:hypothetical protein